MKRKVLKYYVFPVLILVLLLFRQETVLSKADDSSQTKVVRIGYFEDAIFHVGQDDDAPKSGYGYEYYNMLANYTGWKYEYYYGTWTDIYEAFLNGKIDIIDDMSFSEERAALMNYSTLPMGDEHSSIYIPSNNSTIDISDVSTLQGKKIVAYANSQDLAFLEKFISDYSLDTKIILCTGYSDMITKVESGEADGMATTDGFLVDGYKPAFSLGATNIYFCVLKNRTDILDQLNSAMQQNYNDNPNYNFQLKNKYYNISYTHHSFTQAEIKYMEEHPVIKVGYRNLTMPFCETDSNTGKLTGFLSDILVSFEKNVPLKFEPVEFDNNNDMADALRRGEIDCIYPVLDNMWISEKLGYIQTSPLTDQRMVMVYKGTYDGLDAYNKFGYTIGSPEQKIYLELYKSGSDFTGYDSDKETVAAIQNGEIDAMVMNTNSWTYFSRHNMVSDDLYTAFLEGNCSYSFALPRERNPLYSILESLISQTDNMFISESINKNSQVKDEYSVYNFIKHNTGSFALLVVFLLLIFVFGLLYYKRSINKTATLSYSAEHDALTGVYNRSVLNKLERNPENQDKKMCLIMVDIDDFKQINDKFGHDTGDYVIKKVAELLVGATRNADKVIRFGGDEFMLILEGLEISNESVLAEKFSRIKDCLEDTSDGLPETSISIGIAFSERGYCQELFDKADEALYASKSAGKRMFTVNDMIVRK